MSFERKRGDGCLKEKEVESMENGKSATDTGLWEPVPLGTTAFEDKILSILRCSYMYPDSEQCFTYSTAYFIKNQALRERYSAFLAQKKEEGYTDRELEESFGFLMFDDEIEAKKRCQSGIEIDQSTFSSLGDPSKGVYISKYSDCLDLNPWYHGKTGFIVIFRLTKGRVKEVPENYTQNFTQPSVGFDCHMSEHIDTVSATTSTFLAYERTQYYLYELCSEGQPITNPRQVCPFAAIRFLYGKAMPSPAHLMERRYIHETGVFQYTLWQGQLQIHSVTMLVALQSSCGAVLPAQLPPILKMSSSITVSDLKQWLQQANFKTCFTSEAFLKGSSCSVYTLIPLADQDKHTLLSQELKEKDLVLVLQLKDSGFLVVLHSSVFFSYEDTMSNLEDTLQALFVFPDSRLVQKDTKNRWSKSVLSQEIIKALPGLNYAETEAENCLSSQQEAICCVVEQHLQNYAALIQPGMHDSPTREASVFPDHYDVPDVIGHFYNAPKWTQTSHMRLLSYLEHPGDYTLPVARVTELLEAGRNEIISDQGNDIYYCLSSPEDTGVTSSGFWADGDSKERFRKSPHKADVDKGVGKSDGGELEMNKQLPTSEEMVAKDMSITGLPQPVAPEDFVEYEGGSGIKYFDHTEKTNQEKVPATEDFLQAGLVTLAATREAAPAETTHGLGVITTLGKSATEAPITAVSSAEVADLTFDQHNSRVQEHISLPHTKPEVNCTFKKMSRRGSRKRKRGRIPVNKPQENCETLTQPHLPKRKSYQYGLKTIITDCGKIFVPHGSEIPPVDIKTLSQMGKVLPVENNLAELTTEASGISAIPAKKPHAQVSTTDMADRQALLTEVADGQNLPTETVDGQATVRETAHKQTSLTGLIDGQSVYLERADRQFVTLKTIDRLAVPLGMEEGLNLQGSEAQKSTVGSSDTVSNHNKGVQGLVLPSTNCTEKKQLDTSPTLGKKGKRKKPLCPISQVSSLLGDQKDLPSLSTTGLRPKRNKRRRTTHEVENVNFNCENTLTNILQSDPKLRNYLGTDAEIAEPLSEESSKTRGRSRKSVPRKLDLANAAALSEGTQEVTKGSATPVVTETEKFLKPLKKRLRHKTENMKENGLLSFDSSPSYGIDKLCQPQAQGRSSAANSGRGGVINGTSFTAHRSPEAGHCQPPDALSLLADLALSANSDKVLQNLDLVPGTNLDVMGQDFGTSMDDGHSMSGPVLPKMPRRSLMRHKLQYTKRKLPARSPSPKGLVVTGENVLIVSKEHSYSLSPSCLLLGLSGPVPQVLNSDMSGQAGNHSNDAVSAYGKSSIPSCHEGKGGQAVTKSSAESSMRQCHPKDRRRRISRMRKVEEVHGSIQVKRQWKEKYEFHLDSKYTNNPLEKTVIRALHGPWDYSIEETFEQVRLILHMWIALFYSRSAARFFEIEPNGNILRGPSPTSGVHPKESVLKSGLPDSEVCHTLVTPLSSPEPKALDLREESRKSEDSFTAHSEILDLSNNHSEVLDLTVSKHRIEKSPHEVMELNFFHEPGDLPSKHPLQSSRVATFQFKVYRGNVNRILNEESEESEDNNSVVEDGDLCLQNSTESLKNDATYNQLCDYAANLFIGSEESLEKTQEVIQAKNWNNIFDFQCDQFSEKERPSIDEVRQSRTCYIQSCKFIPISFSPIVVAPSACVESRTKTDAVFASDTNIHTEFRDGRNDSGKGHAVVTSNTHELVKVHKCSSKVLSDDFDNSVLEEQIQPCAEKNSKKTVNLVENSDSQCTVPDLDAESYNHSVSVFAKTQTVSSDKRVYFYPGASTLTQGDLSFNHEPNTYICTSSDTTMRSYAESGSNSEATFSGNSLSSKTKIPVNIPVCCQVISDTEKGLSDSDMSSLQTGHESCPGKNYKFASIPANTKKLLHSDCENTVDSILLSTEEQQGGSCEPLATRNCDLTDFSILHVPGALNTRKDCKYSDQSSLALSKNFQEQDESRLDLGEIHPHLYQTNQTNDEASNSSRKLTATENVENIETEICLKNSDDAEACQKSCDCELITDGKNDIESVSQRQIETSYLNKKVATTDDTSENDFKWIPEAKPSSPGPDSQSHLRISKNNTNSSENLKSSSVCVNQLTNDASEQDPRVCNSMYDHSEDSGETPGVSSIGCNNVMSEEMPFEVNSRNLTQFHHLHESNKKVSSPEVSPQPSLDVCSSLNVDKYDDFDPSTNTRISLQDNLLLNYEKTDSDSTIVSARTSLEKELQLNNNFNLKKSLESACTSPEEDNKGNCITQKIQSAFLESSQLCGYDSASFDSHPSKQDLANKNNSDSQCSVMDLKPCKKQECGGLDDICVSPQCPLHKCTIGIESQVDPNARLTSVDQLRTHVYQQHAGIEERMCCDDNESEETAKCSISSSTDYYDVGRLSTAYNPESMSYCSKARHYPELFYQKGMIDEQVDNEALDYGKEVHSWSFYHQKDNLAVTPPLKSDKYETEWSDNHKNDRRQLLTSTLVCVKEKDCRTPSSVPSIITTVDSKGIRVTYENCPTVKPVFSRHVKTIKNTNMADSSLQGFFQKWEKLHLTKPDITQDTMDLEYLIFSEKMNQILKKVQKNRTSCRSSRYPWRSQLMSGDDIVPHSAGSPVTKCTISVDFPNKTRRSELKSSFPFVPCDLPRHLNKLSYVTSKSDTHPGVSSISSDCSSTYQTLMNDICSSREIVHHTRKLKIGPWKIDEQTDVCGQTQQEMFNKLQEQLNTVVRRTCKTKFRFYILVTSANAFFDQTKELLEAESHVSVDPEQFEMGLKNTSMPLLIILRNEDIAEHICTIPHLLELKKTPSVLFAGIDQPDDILTLTHQELFTKGGFVMCDAAVLDSLMLDNMKTLVEFLEELSRNGRWTWFLHYRDCRLLKEKERTSMDAKKRKQFLDQCQEAGLVQTLPYHECDILSREQPDYLQCLLHLQAQYATVRFAVFITDTPNDSFGTYGILVMKINTFLQIYRNKVCESVLFW